MNIGLIDVDSHNFPNLCLMKISAYHKGRGDHVEWWSRQETCRDGAITNGYSELVRSLKITKEEEHV